MGKNVLVSVLIMSMLLNVAVGVFEPIKTVADQAQKGVYLAKQVFGRKAMEENNGGEKLQAAGDCDQGENNAENVKGAKFVFYPLNGSPNNDAIFRKTLEKVADKNDKSFKDTIMQAAKSVINKHD
ncbi:hypothetical protein CUMW_214260 [Citrus unshiu]|uniref:Pollen allergen Poa p IX/Phl p VI domain-containing protein n=1 Tax=Citrus unshiu TaxID=55188 RepID=A0A2H5QBF5_CITUN|nr:hypothetical protein CUMW_214260 [Citrus unshiu]